MQNVDWRAQKLTDCIRYFVRRALREDVRSNGYDRHVTERTLRAFISGLLYYRDEDEDEETGQLVRKKQRRSGNHGLDAVFGKSGDRAWLTDYSNTLGMVRQLPLREDEQAKMRASLEECLAKLVRRRTGW